jgi:hypothetical protein
METALWIIIGLLVFVAAFQLYQWIEVNSARRDMLRAFADARRATSRRQAGLGPPRE